MIRLAANAAAGVTGLVQRADSTMATYQVGPFKFT